MVPATGRPAWFHASALPETRPTPVTRAKATAPATAHVTRYPAVKAIGNSRDRFRVMREYKATVGATDGNIIAAIITTQTPRNQLTAPRPVQGPLSIPRI